MLLEPVFVMALGKTQGSEEGYRGSVDRKSKGFCVGWTILVNSFCVYLESVDGY